MNNPIYLNQSLNFMLLGMLKIIYDKYIVKMPKSPNIVGIGLNN